MAVRRTGPVVPMVRIAFAAGDPELQLWVQRLDAAGIRCRVQDYNGSNPTTTIFTNAYRAELWVREKDEAAARELLGM